MSWIGWQFFKWINPQCDIVCALWGCGRGGDLRVHPSPSVDRVCGLGLTVGATGTGAPTVHEDL